MLSDALGVIEGLEMSLSVSLLEMLALCNQIMECVVKYLILNEEEKKIY